MNIEELEKICKKNKHPHHVGTMEEYAKIYEIQERLYNIFPKLITVAKAARDTVNEKCVMGGINDPLLGRDKSIWKRIEEMKKSLEELEK